MSASGGAASGSSRLRLSKPVSGGTSMLAHAQAMTVLPAHTVQQAYPPISKEAYPRDEAAGAVEVLLKQEETGARPLLALTDAVGGAAVGITAGTHPSEHGPTAVPPTAEMCAVIATGIDIVDISGAVTMKQLSGSGRMRKVKRFDLNEQDLDNNAGANLHNTKPTTSGHSSDFSLGKEVTSSSGSEFDAGASDSEDERPKKKSKPAHQKPASGKGAASGSRAASGGTDKGRRAASAGPASGSTAGRKGASAGAARASGGAGRAKPDDAGATAARASSSGTTAVKTSKRAAPTAKSGCDMTVLPGQTGTAARTSAGRPAVTTAAKRSAAASGGAQESGGAAKLRRMAATKEAAPSTQANTVLAGAVPAPLSVGGVTLPAAIDNDPSLTPKDQPAVSTDQLAASMDATPPTVAGHGMGIIPSVYTVPSADGGTSAGSGPSRVEAPGSSLPACAQLVEVSPGDAAFNRSNGAKNAAALLARAPAPAKAAATAGLTSAALALKGRALKASAVRIAATSTASIKPLPADTSGGASSGSGAASGGSNPVSGLKLGAPGALMYRVSGLRRPGGFKKPAFVGKGAQG